mgnify:CR=1 FL=1
MKIFMRILAASASILWASAAYADKEPIVFASLQDMTKAYTFLMVEVSQGQQDYIAALNADGGIDGHPVRLIVRDHGNEPQRGIEAYNRAVGEGAVMVNIGSSPVSGALITRVEEDKVPMMTLSVGRPEASDGTVFNYSFPAGPTHWSQIAALFDYIDKHEGGLEGKKIAVVHIDHPGGRAMLTIPERLAETKDFEVRGFGYPSPGTEQSAVWTEVRRMRPDFVVLGGAGVGQPVSIREAVRNGISPTQLLSAPWLAETDMEAVGTSVAIGIKRVELAAPGTDHPIIANIIDKVIEPGNGAGDLKNVGRSYYNLGVGSMTLAVEGARLALEEFGAPLTGEKLKQGLEMVKDFDAQGLIPPFTFTAEDHQGGGNTRISEWDGESWVPKTEWTSSYQDIVWEEIKKASDAFRKGG